MATYADLGSIHYFSHISGHECLRAVGWLGEADEFPVGPCPGEFRSKLATLCTDPWQPGWFMGAHACELCDSSSADVAMGAENVFVPGEGCVYVAPVLLRHYLDAHGYTPPGEFIDAVMRCPEMGSPDYEKAMDRAGGGELLQGRPNPNGPGGAMG